MRLTVILVLAACLKVSAGGYAQQITLRAKDMPCESVFREITRQSGYQFFFNKRLIRNARNVSVELNAVPVERAIEICFAGQPFDYAIINKTVVIRKKEERLVVIPETAPAEIPPITVTGKITDENGDPLYGVSIIEKGNPNMGTTTDVDGNFSLNLSSNAILLISYTGYEKQEVAVNNRTTVNIVLIGEIKVLDQVVAVGYGSARKRDLTGAVASVKITDELSQLPNVSIVQALQGTIPGVNVGITNRAGEEPSLTVRGNNTLSGNASAPLIVVDNIIYRGSLIDLNPKDIATIDILKDASAAAIFGSQASSGVILITTKRGTVTEKPRFNFSTSHTVQVPSNEMVPMGREELDEFIRNTNWERGSRLGPDYLQRNPDFQYYSMLKSADLTKGFLDGVENNWWNDFTRNGRISSYDLSMNGGSKAIRYFVSGGMQDVLGYIKNDKYRRYSFRINLDADINPWLRIGLQSSLALSNYSGVEPSASGIFTMQPWAPIYDDEGNHHLTPNGSSVNPYLTLQVNDDDRRFSGNGNLYAHIKIPFIDGLSYRINYGNNYRTNILNRFDAWGAGFQGSGLKNFSENYIWTVDNIVTYETSLNKHRLKLDLVYGVEKSKYQYTNASSSRFAIDDLGYWRLQAGEQASFSINTGGAQSSSLYSSGRAFYSFNDKYMITATLRRDGFSGFGSDKKMGTFPSVSVAWVASEENFFRSGWINYLKLRGSYGKSGRRAVDPYSTMAIVAMSPVYVFGDGAQATMGQWISTMANNQLGWETTTGVNMGMDFNLFNSRVQGNIDYYRNHTEDILYGIQLPTMTGFSSISTNIGRVKNHGIELNISGDVLRYSDFNWNAGFNFSRNRNQIISIIGMDGDGDGKEDDLIANGLFIGQPQNVIYDYEITGEMWQLADRERGIIPAGFFPGTLKIVDRNNDGEISATDDRTILGYTDPSYRFGITNTLKYKNFSLYLFINSIQGGKKFYRALVDPAWDFNNYEFITQGNGPKGAWDYWMPENPGAKYRRTDIRPAYEGFHYDSRSFIRLQDVTLSYSFGSKVTNKLAPGGMRLYISGKNLFTITKWEGVDPELGTRISPGVLPVMRSFLLGIDITF
ncbi:MAG: TonB-dependent receptor [Chitinophagaceae bacterium]|nr:TonB-dependent receptor [Chitinophagaceae bacterium]MCW5928294.1 TonB-dependent receptor [Chitinophagaceae bacterium]